MGILLAVIIPPLMLGTQVRIEHQVTVTVLGPDEPVYYMIGQFEPLTEIKRELQKNPQVVHSAYILNKTLLAHAAEDGREDVVRLLLEMGADPNGKGRPGEYTPLMTAVVHGQGTMARILIEHGADPDLRYGYGPTPRQMAEYEGNQRMLSILAEAGNKDGGDDSEPSPGVLELTVPPDASGDRE